MVGKYYSKSWVQKKILRMSDEEIAEVEEQNRADEISTSNNTENELDNEPSTEGNNNDANN
jgi:hypothetical protein